MKIAALRVAERSRVRTSFGLGTIEVYRHVTLVMDRFHGGYMEPLTNCFVAMRCRQEDDSYIVRLDFGGVGYFQARDVNCVDLRLLDRIPKPFSADQIFNEFQGRISREEAAALHLRAERAYRQLQTFCEQHADTISFISTNAEYGGQYSEALSSLLDPSLADAGSRLRTAAGRELTKLKQMGFTAKETLENDVLDGKDSSAFFAQAAKVLSQLKSSDEVKGLKASLREKASAELAAVKKKLGATSSGSGTSTPSAAPTDQKLVLSQVLQAFDERLNAQTPRLNALKDSISDPSLPSDILEKLQQHESELIRAQETILELEKKASAKLGVSSIANLDPSALVAKAEELLPQVSGKAGLLLQSTEKYWTRIQQTEQGQTLLLKAKELAKSVENPDAFCGNVTKAIADVDFDKIAAWGNTLTSDKEKRQNFIDRVKDNCLDFFMSVLPTIKIDTISGVEDGVEYSLSSLDLSNFRVKKECVKVRMGTVVDEELFTVRATHLTALLNGFQWNFVQKYFPYLHGGGVADAVLTGGVISLGFKAEKTVVNAETGEVKPILVLNSMEIEIREELKLTVQGSWFSAVYNLLASVFAELIREYLAKTMESKLLGHMIRLLTTLNTQMDQYWPLVFQLLDIRVDDLPAASPWRGAKEVEIQLQELDITFADRQSVPFAFAKGVLNKYVVVSKIVDMERISSSSTGDDGFAADLMRVPVGSSVVAINGLSCSKLTLGEVKKLMETLPEPFTIRFTLIPEDVVKNRQQRIVPRPETSSFVFRAEGPLGLRLRSRPLAPCGVIVVGFTEIEGKKCSVELSGKIQIGQMVTKINDTDVRFMKLAEVLSILRETKKRPLTMHFASSPDGVIKLRSWPPMIEMEEAASYAGSDDEVRALGDRMYVVVSAFERVPSFAQRTHTVSKGDVLVRVNGQPITSPHVKGFAAIMDRLRDVANEKTTMIATFVSQEDYMVIRLDLQRSKGVGTIAPESETDRRTKGEELDASGDETTTLSETPVSPANEDEEKTTATTDDNNEDCLHRVQTKEIEFPGPPLGILFGNWKEEAAFVRAFISSAGPAEKTGLIRLGQAVLQVCGQSVPADTTVEAVEEMIENVQTTPNSEGKKPKFTITVRDLELERELMKVEQVTKTRK